MVKAEMKAESDACRQKTLAKLAEEEDIAKGEQMARQALRNEARQVYSRELRAAAREAPTAPTPPPNVPELETDPATQAEAASSEASTQPHEPTKESAAARVEALLRERAERRQHDLEGVAALRERVAARIPNRDRWGRTADGPTASAGPSTANAEARSSEHRSLFTWNPPAPITDGAAPQPQPAAATRSQAAQDAWSWVQQ